MLLQTLDWKRVNRPLSLSLLSFNYQNRIYFNFNFKFVRSLFAMLIYFERIITIFLPFSRCFQLVVVSKKMWKKAYFIRGTFVAGYARLTVVRLKWKIVFIYFNRFAFISFIYLVTTEPEQKKIIKKSWNSTDTLISSFIYTKYFYSILLCCFHHGEWMNECRVVSNDTIFFSRLSVRWYLCWIENWVPFESVLVAITCATQMARITILWHILVANYLFRKIIVEGIIWQMKRVAADAMLCRIFFFFFEFDTISHSCVDLMEYVFSVFGLASNIDSMTYKMHWSQMQRL